MHEIDHRFSVEGHVCSPDGKPVADAQVIIKDTRASIGASAYTDRDGYFKGTLHLHNENRGDPILVSVQDQEKKVAADFDPKDAKRERKITVNFGSGCEALDETVPLWVYYGAGAGAVAVLALVGTRIARKQQRADKGRKGKRT
jgi:hypothetical protein